MGYAGNLAQGLSASGLLAFCFRSSKLMRLILGPLPGCIILRLLLLEVLYFISAVNYVFKVYRLLHMQDSSYPLAYYRRMMSLMVHFPYFSARGACAVCCLFMQQLMLWCMRHLWCCMRDLSRNAKCTGPLACSLQHVVVWKVLRSIPMH